MNNKIKEYLGLWQQYIGEEKLNPAWDFNRWQPFSDEMSKKIYLAWEKLTPEEQLEISKLGWYFLGRNKKL